MATYNTIPTGEPLLQPKGRSMKALVAGAAAASFVFGVCVMTAVSIKTAPKQAGFLAGDIASGTVRILMPYSAGTCIGIGRAKDDPRGVALVATPCSASKDQLFEIENVGPLTLETFQLKVGTFCVTALKDEPYETARGLHTFTSTPNPDSLTNPDGVKLATLKDPESPYTVSLPVRRIMLINKCSPPPALIPRMRSRRFLASA